MKRWLSNSSVVALSLLLTGGVVWAQATGGFAGRVSDTSGAVLPGVTVTVTYSEPQDAPTPGQWETTGSCDGCACPNEAPFCGFGCAEPVGIIPALSPWGLIAFGLLLIGAVFVAIRRRPLYR